jgi:emfourin
VRITFQSQGGIAFFPGLNRPVVIDTAQLPAEQRSNLEGLVQATRFFALPPTVGTTRRGAADFREYTLKVEDGVQNYTVHVTEPFENSDLEELISALQSHARAQSRSTPTKSS